MDPRARIEAFLADYVAAHAEVKPLFDNRKENGAEDPFSAWYAKLEELRAAHQMERSLKCTDREGWLRGCDLSL